MSERVYSGRSGYGVIVEQALELGPIIPKNPQSAPAFGWGTEGSGTLQLAMSMLSDVVGEVMAQDLFVLFAADIVRHFTPEWRLTESAIRLWVETQKQRAS